MRMRSRNTGLRFKAAPTWRTHSCLPCRHHSDIALAPGVEHPEQAQRSNGGPNARFGRQTLINAG